MEKFHFAFWRPLWRNARCSY